MNKKNKKRDLAALVLAITVVILLNFVNSFVFHRFDLTSEKRYTLAPATKALLAKLDEVVYVKVYLDGDFPAGFKRLRNETREMLDEFRTYSHDNIEYEFINPSENPDKKQQNELFKQLYDKGLQPFNVEDKTDEGSTQQVIWPGAIVSYHGREAAWKLLKTSMGYSAEGQLNNSVQSLEYEFASCIHNLTTDTHNEVGFIEGQGELDTLAVDDIKNALGEFYTLKRVKIGGQLGALKDLTTIVIAKPDTAFSEQDKFVIDQFVMRGGKILWCVDPLETRVDSLATGRTYGVAYDLKLDDMLFKYGVRLNQNLILDLQSSALPVNTAFHGQQPRVELRPWVYVPVILPTINHPIVKNLDVIKFDYVSSIDMVDSGPGINKTVLLTTSKNSKLLNAPVRVDMSRMRMQEDESKFRAGPQPVAVLLEGQFESLYKNRLPPSIADSKDIGFTDHSVNTKMIVISDGDIIRNDIQGSSGKPYPLGYDKYTKQQFGNKNFILNCINYLCDDSGLISVRSRELTLRLLDKKKIKDDKLKWQLINTLIPLGLVLLYAIIHFIRRKRKYAN
ncbi:MAG: hypothetical protein JWP12_3722 [Bacteroidetes bacterium]|nr:hypothetical protein [Bacteroidota bacterium]